MKNEKKQELSQEELSQAAGGHGEHLQMDQKSADQVKKASGGTQLSSGGSGEGGQLDEGVKR